MNKKHIIIASIAAVGIFIVGYFVGDTTATDRANRAVDASIAIKMANAKAEAESTTPTNEKPEQEVITDAITTLPSELEISGIKVTLKSDTQDADSLKLYVTYENKTSGTISTGDGQCKIIANGTQYEYDSDFNFERYYEKSVAHAPGDIEPGVKSDSVIFFKPIPNVDKINIVLNSNLENYKFNDVKVKVNK